MDTFILIGITGIGLGALYFLVASGLSLIYGLMGVLNFAHGSFLSVGAFVGYWIATQLGPETSMVDFILAMIVGGLAAGLFALLMEQLLITRLYDRHIDQALVLFSALQSRRRNLISELLVAIGPMRAGMWRSSFLN